MALLLPLLDTIEINRLLQLQWMNFLLACRSSELRYLTIVFLKLNESRYFTCTLKTATLQNKGFFLSFSQAVITYEMAFTGLLATEKLP